MGFISATLDEEVDYGFEGGPEYSTNIVDLENGIEHRDSAWIYPRHRYSANFGNLKDESRDIIVAVFHAARGKRHSFKFKDWNDYKATNEILQVSVGTTDPAQLYKTYVFGEAYTIRPVQAIKFATLKTSGGASIDGTLDINTGLFYPQNAWAASSCLWSGEFYVWVRFQNDYNSFSINSWQANTASVDLQEDKIPITATNLPMSWEE